MTVHEMMKARWASGVYESSRHTSKNAWKGKRWQETIRVRRLRAGLSPLGATTPNSVAQADVEPPDSGGAKP